VVTALRILVAVSLLVVLIRSGGIRWSALREVFAVWPLTLAALGLMLMGLVLTSWRLCVLFRPRGLGLSLAASTRLTLIGMFFNTSLPGAGGGDLVRMYYGARGHEGRRAEIVTVMVLDRVAGMFALILWPLLVAPAVFSLWRGNPALTALLGAGAAMAVGMAVVFVVAWSPMFAPDGRLDGWVRRLPAGALLAQVMETIAGYRTHRRAVVQAVGISLLSHTLAMSAALLLARITNPDGFSWAMSILIPMGFMANTIPLTPGGLGVGEAAFDSLFRLAGLHGGAEVLLGWRLLILAVGLVGLGAYLHGRRDFVEAPTRPGDSLQGLRA